MVKKNAKNTPAGRSGPSKPARKPRRIFPWLFLTLFLVAGIAAAGVYFQLIPVDPEWIAKWETMAEKIPGMKKPEEVAAGKPKTNFPLVDLEGAKKPAPAVNTAPANILGSTAAASPAVAPPSGAQAAKPAAGKEAADTAKVYAKLAKLYNVMKPEEAVAVFNNLEDEQVVMIVSRMEEDAAAKVMSSLEPKRAARLTQAMIKRK